jgi:hypothetical protein
MKTVRAVVPTAQSGLPTIADGGSVEQQTGNSMQVIAPDPVLATQLEVATSPPDETSQINPLLAEATPSTEDAEAAPAPATPDTGGQSSRRNSSQSRSSGKRNKGRK